MSKKSTTTTKNTDNKKIFIIVFVLSGVGILCILSTFVAVVAGLTVLKINNYNDLADSTIQIDANINIDDNGTYDNLFGDKDTTDDSSLTDYDVDIINTAGIGVNLEVDNNEVIVLNRELGYESENPFVRARKGYQILLVEVQIRNTGTESINANQYNFTLLDSKGNSLKSEAIRKEPMFVGEKLKSGESITGFLTFEVKESESKFRFKYETSLLTKEAIEFEI